MELNPKTLNPKQNRFELVVPPCLLNAVSVRVAHLGRSPKIGGNCLGVLMIRITLFLGPYWGSPI